jgi:hypothetical protein
MLDKILSGGQAGADQAGWRAARVFGIPTGGWVPAGFLTDEGPRPEFAERFGAVEVPADGPSTGSEPNVRDADATLWFGETTTPEAQETVGACLRLGKPCLPVYPAASFTPAHVATWLAENQVRTLNVAGTGEGEAPGIGAWVEQFLVEVLRQLGHEPA